jgi:SAM-dependent methyltransferase
MICAMGAWWETFFDLEYARLWSDTLPPARTALEVEGLWDLLGLSATSRVLDAPCGQGRIALALAERGASVLGVDHSYDMLSLAEQARGAVAPDRSRYLRWDLRQPLAESGFDAALNLFSSLGYGTEDEDRAILRTLRTALRPGGLVFIESNHRDSIVRALARSPTPSMRASDGTLVIHEPKLDPLTGVIDAVWYWSGPAGSGTKHATIRAYSATELIGIAGSAGLRLRSAHDGCSARPFPVGDPTAARRIGLLFEIA